jgi:hypothetical protein
LMSGDARQRPCNDCRDQQGCHITATRRIMHILSHATTEIMQAFVLIDIFM